jgi:hypothetical protein
MTCAIIYALRAEVASDVLRAFYTQLTFVILWMVCRREQGDVFPGAIRLTILVWLGVGLYQYTAVALGLPVEITGRFVEGRSGVPSLASESSSYGSLSVLHMMYLIAERKASNNIYIACAAASVVLSGSLLAVLLLLFPLMKLSVKLRVAVVVGIPLLVLADYQLTSAGVTSRLFSLMYGEVGAASSLLLDPSLNLRIGHVYFTLVENLVDSLLLTSPVSFMAHYNGFAFDSRIFIDTGSNFILPAAGELIYGSGLAGVLLLVVFLARAQAQCATRAERVGKIAFIIACMLNPISLSNVFLVMYAQRKS